MRTQPPEYLKNNTYFRQEIDGYIASPVSRPVIKTLDTFKEVLGLCLGHMLFTVTNKNSGDSPTVPIYIHLLKGDGWEIIQSLDMPDDLVRVIQRVKLDRSIFPDKFTHEHVQEILGCVSTALNSAKESENVRRSSKWLLDSHIGENMVLSFVQCMVAIEITLGDKAVTDVVGLKTLLGDRLAYLIGVSKKQREKFIKEFRECYDTRSRIVHSGHEQLNKAQENQLATLQWMCGRMIRKEIELIRKDEQNG